MRNILVITALIFALAINGSFAQKKSLGGSKPAEGTKKEEVKKTDSPKKELNEKSTESKKQTASKTDKAKKGPKPIKGKIISLNGLAMGKYDVNKKEAADLVANGQALGFMVGEGKNGKIYLVYNEDGTLASKKLSNYAANKYIGIQGKTKKVNGINIIIATMIESMD